MKDMKLLLIDLEGGAQVKVLAGSMSARGYFPLPDGVLDRGVPGPHIMNRREERIPLSQALQRALSPSARAVPV